MYELDRLDRKILSELDRDARQPLSAIAKAARVGSDLIAYRVAKYERDGLIGRYSAVVDPLAAGWWVIKVYVKLVMSASKIASFVKFLDRHPSIYWLAELHGRYDLLYSFCTDSPHHASILPDLIRRKFGQLIVDQELHILTVVNRISRKYLGFVAPRDYVLSASAARPVVDSTDAELLNLLYSNARTPITTLAEKLDIAPATVRTRIEKLEKAKIILAYRAQLNHSVLGLTLFKLLVQFSDYSAEFEHRITSFCRTHSAVTLFVRQLGRFPFEVEVEVDGYTGLNNFVDEFRGLFDSGIQTCEVLLVKRDLYHRFPAHAANKESSTVLR